MKDVKSRIFNGVMYIGLGLFVALLAYQIKKSILFLWGGAGILIFQGILYFVSVYNRKKHDYYFNSNFGIDQINKLNKNLNMIDKIIKFSPLVFSIIVVGWMFVVSGFDFYTLFALVIYILLVWRF